MDMEGYVHTLVVYIVLYYMLCKGGDYGNVISPTTNINTPFVVGPATYVSFDSRRALHSRVTLGPPRGLLYIVQGVKGLGGRGLGF